MLFIFGGKIILNKRLFVSFVPLCCGKKLLLMTVHISHIIAYVIVYFLVWTFCYDYYYYLLVFLFHFIPLALFQEFWSICILRLHMLLSFFYSLCSFFCWYWPVESLLFSLTFLSSHFVWWISCQPLLLGCSVCF